MNSRTISAAPCSACFLKIKILSSSDAIPHFISKANIQHFNISYHILDMHDIEYHKSILCCQYLATCLRHREDSTKTQLTGMIQPLTTCITLMLSRNTQTCQVLYSTLISSSFFLFYYSSSSYSSSYFSPTIPLLHLILQPLTQLALLMRISNYFFSSILRHHIKDLPRVT